MKQNQEPLQVEWQEPSPEHSASSQELSSSDEEEIEDFRPSVIPASSKNTKNFRGGRSPRLVSTQSHIACLIM
jgi:ribosomal protein L24E